MLCNGSHIPARPVDEAIPIEPRGPGEWIVVAPRGERSLHVYRLAPADWLVSEVGCGTEGQGRRLGDALTALAAGRSRPVWWELAAATLDAYGAAELEAAQDQPRRAS
jgi:hypothetical protein